MSPKMQEALDKLAVFPERGLPKGAFHHSTVTALLKSGTVEGVPGDDTSIRVKANETADAAAHPVVCVCGMRAGDFHNPECRIMAGMLATLDKSVTVPGCEVCRLPVMPGGIGHTLCDVPRTAFAIRVARYLIGEASFNLVDALGTVDTYREIVDFGEGFGSDVDSVARKITALRDMRLSAVTMADRRIIPIGDADLALLSGDPAPLTVLVPVIIEEYVPSVFLARNGKRKATGVNRRRRQVAGR